MATVEYAVLRIGIKTYGKWRHVVGAWRLPAGCNDKTEQHLAGQIADAVKGWWDRYAIPRRKYNPVYHVSCVVSLSVDKIDGELLANDLLPAHSPDRFRPAPPIPSLRGEPVHE